MPVKKNAERMGEFNEPPRNLTPVSEEVNFPRSLDDTVANSKHGEAKDKEDQTRNAHLYREKEHKINLNAYDRRRNYRQQRTSGSFSNSTGGTHSISRPISINKYGKNTPIVNSCQEPQIARSLEEKANGRQPILKQNRHRSVTATMSNQEGSTRTRRISFQRLSTTSDGTGTYVDSFDYEEEYYDEPFSDTDDETHRLPIKPSLFIPRGRIRTLSGTIPPVGYCPKWGGPTMCLSCLQFFNLPEMVQTFSNHLLLEHSIIIADIELIVDLKRYIEYWRQRLNSDNIENIFSKLKPAENDQFHGKVDHYFYMSDSVKEDWDLRQRLAMRRLQEVALFNFYIDNTYSANLCIAVEFYSNTDNFRHFYANSVRERIGNRSKLIHHLYTIHHLNLGSPDNLVFVHEYIEHLRDKILRNTCIYCEQVFATRTHLMDHMRRQSHREVNPKNSYYDRFYIINYLELGKRWLDVIAEDFEDSMPTFVDSDDEADEQLVWKECCVDEIDDERPQALCLYCPTTAEAIEELICHIKKMHGIDFIALIEEQKLTTYDRLKIINCIRKEWSNKPKFYIKTPSTEEHDETNAPICLPSRDEWDKEEHLIPIFGNDHLPWMLESWLIAERKDIVQYDIKSNEGEKNSELPTDQSFFNKLIEESRENTVEQVLAEDLGNYSNPLLRELQEDLKL